MNLNRGTNGGLLSFLSYTVAVVFFLLAFFAETSTYFTQPKEVFLGLALFALAFVLERLGC
jgi:hypothetical protein